MVKVPKNSGGLIKHRAAEGKAKRRTEKKTYLK